MKPSKTKEPSLPPPNRAKTESEELDALHAQKSNPARLMEATIEAKSKKRRREEKAKSASWKPSP